MSLVRIKYGVEYDPDRNDDSPSSARWIVAAALAVAVVSFIAGAFRRTPSHGDAVPEIVPPPAEEHPAPPPDIPMEPIDLSGINARPAKVRNLLMRLDEASRSGDVKMQISTIESIRALPGNAAADVADGLVERLGILNWSLMFDRHNPQWVAEVTVKPGDTVSRIAAEHGSTIASLLKLNSLSNADRISAGREVKVLNHPRFNLTVHKKLKSVDLFLNGKLFKRYEIDADAAGISGEPGDYKTSAKLRDTFRELGIDLPAESMEELEMLVPKDSHLNITAF